MWCIGAATHHKWCLHCINSTGSESLCAIITHHRELATKGCNDVENRHNACASQPMTRRILISTQTFFLVHVYSKSRWPTLLQTCHALEGTQKVPAPVRSVGFNKSAEVKLVADPALDMSLAYEYGSCTVLYEVTWLGSGRLVVRVPLLLFRRY